MPLCTALLYSKKEGQKLNNTIQMKTAMQLKCFHKAEKKELLLYITFKKTKKQNQKTCHTL